MQGSDGPKFINLHLRLRLQVAAGKVGYSNVAVEQAPSELSKGEAISIKKIHSFITVKKKS